MIPMINIVAWVNLLTHRFLVIFPENCCQPIWQ